MALVRRGHKELTVSDTQVEAYLADGYSQVDEKTGEVVQEPTNGNPVPFAEFAKLKAELKAAQDELKALKAAAKKAEK